MSDYLEPYRKAVEDLGPEFGSLLWRSKRFQEIRFKVLVETAAIGLSPPDKLATPLRLEGRVIADMGCGRADLLRWMHAIRLSYGRYIGVEAIPELAEESRSIIEQEGHEEASVIDADFAADPSVFDALVKNHGAEVIMFSGSLNTFDQDAAARVIRAAFEAVRKIKGGAVVFNFLSDKIDRTKAGDTGPAKRFDTNAMITMMSELTTRYALRHDYLAGHDATIGLFSEVGSAAKP